MCVVQKRWVSRQSLVPGHSSIAAVVNSVIGGHHRGCSALVMWHHIVVSRRGRGPRRLRVRRTSPGIGESTWPGRGAARTRGSGCRPPIRRPPVPAPRMHCRRPRPYRSAESRAPVIRYGASAPVIHCSWARSWAVRCCAAAAAHSALFRRRAAARSPTARNVVGAGMVFTPAGVSADSMFRGAVLSSKSFSKLALIRCDSTSPHLS